MNEHDRTALVALIANLPADTRLELVRMYRRSIANQLDLIGMRPCTNGEPLVVALHGLAGSAAMMQDQELSKAARSMEGDLRAGRVDPAWQHWPTIQALAQRTLAQLDSIEAAGA
jgi:HPt (histidine-containing phosphotransfer) domain-containing protein